MKSSFSGKLGNCIEVVQHAFHSNHVVVRETQPVYGMDTSVMVTTKPNLKAFFDGVKAGEFDHLVEGDKNELQAG